MQFIVHDDPVRRAARNYIARADLAPFGLPGQLEQLWLHPQAEDDTYTLACIPFRTYGLALGDRVRLSEDGTTVTELAEPSGHKVLRMLLMPSSETGRLQEGIDRIKEAITTGGLLSEWSGDRHVAVDVPPGADASGLFAVMNREVTEAGAAWEWADVLAFSR